MAAYRIDIIHSSQDTSKAEQREHVLDLTDHHTGSDIPIWMVYGTHSAATWHTHPHWSALVSLRVQPASAWSPGLSLFAFYLA